MLFHDFVISIRGTARLSDQSGRSEDTSLLQYDPTLIIVIIMCINTSLSTFISYFILTAHTTYHNKYITGFT